MEKVPTTWLVSLHRYYAEEILNGTKLFEYRKRKMSCREGDRVLVYATHPDKVILGEFTVGPDSRYGVSPLEAIEAAAVDERIALAQYFCSPILAKSVTALQVANPIRYDVPQSLETMCGLKRGPHSYRRAEVINEPQVLGASCR